MKVCVCAWFKNERRMEHQNKMEEDEIKTNECEHKGGKILA